MPSMSLSLMVLVACIVLCLLFLLTAWGRYQLGHGARALLRGLGLVLIVVGLYLTHLADLAANGIRSIYDWAMRTHMGTRLIAGFSVAGAGLLFFLIGTFMRRRTRDERREVRRARKGVVDGASRPGTAVAAGPATRSVPVKGRGATASGLDAEDAEVADILDKRGIN